MNTFNEYKMNELLKKLDKNFFNSLSYDEQTEILEDFIDYILESLNEDNNIKTSVGIDNINNMVPMEVDKLIEHIGRDEFREMLRRIVKDGGFQLVKIDKDEIDNIASKLKNHENLNEEEQKIVDTIINNNNFNSNEENIQFTTYSYLKTLIECSAYNKSNDDVKFLYTLEPFANAEFIFSLGCCLADKKSSIRKMFDKRGFNKLIDMINNTTDDFLELIVNYSKENDISPERTLLSLSLINKLMSNALKLSIDNINNKEQYLIDILTAIEFDEFDEKELIELLNGSNISNLSKKNDVSSPNGEYKESKKDDNMDIRKLLLDD